jgi:cortactin
LTIKPAVPPKPNADDDWETDPDFINDISEKESRWGARTVTGSGHQESIRLDQLREEVLKSDRELKEKQDMPKPSLGYGGSFGIETGRQDKSAVGWEHNEKTVPHASQKGTSCILYVHINVLVFLRL